MENGLQDGFAPAWLEVTRLIIANAKHRKGFRLGASELTPSFILSQAEGELNELRKAEYIAHRTGLAADYAEVKNELADLLGVLFHLAQKLNFTPEEITAAMLAKFKERFTIES